MLFTAVRPMRLTKIQEPFDDEAYLFEPMWDGGRIILHKQGNRMEAYTRTGKPVSAMFPELQEVTRRIDSHTAVLDCEGVCMRSGKPVFDDFMHRMRLSRSMKIAQACETHPVTFVAFDVLYTDRERLQEPLLERKRLLKQIVEPSTVITPTSFIHAEGKALYKATQEMGLAGIIAKRKSSIYQLDAISQDWRALHHVKSIDVMILGYRTEPRFALLIGLNFRTVKNKPVGIVESGFRPSDIQRFFHLTAAFNKQEDGQIQWLERRLCCRIEYRGHTELHQLQSAAFLAFLEDKRPETCVWGRS